MLQPGRLSQGADLDGRQPNRNTEAGVERIIMMVGVIPDDLRREVLKRTRRSLVASADVLQRSLIKGLARSAGVSVALVNSMHIGTFPRSSSVLRAKSGAIQLSDIAGVAGENAGFLNLPVLGVWSRARSMRRSYDRITSSETGRHVVFVYSLLDWNMLFLSSLPRSATAPTVCLLVTDLPENMVLFGERKQPFRTLYHKARHRFLRTAISRGLDRVDVFVLLTPHMRSKLPCEGRRVIEMEGIVDTSVYDDVRTRFARPADAVHRIAYTGGLEAELGVQDLLEAFRGIPDPDIRLFICGDGQLRPMVERDAATDSRIFYEGPVSFQRAVEVQLGASVLVCPTRIDGEVSKYAFPAKVLEYLYSGNVVVSRRLEAIPSEYDPFLVFAEDASIEELRQAIQRGLRASRLVSESTREAQRSFIRENTSIEARAKSILELLEGGVES